MSEERLLQRLEDLDGRLTELCRRLPDSHLDEGYDRRFYGRLTRDAAEAVIPAHLYTVEDVLTAMEGARAKLAALRRSRELAEERLADETIPGQLVLAGFGGESLPLAS